MVRPFRAYAALAAAPDDRPATTAAARAALFLFVCGGFVSLVTAGRLVAFHVVSTMAFWSFIPAVQAGAFLVALRLAGGRPGWGALSMYFAGHGPWMVVFVALAGMCLFAPDPYEAFMALVRSGALLGVLVAVIAWSGVLTYACYRAGQGLSRRRAGAATAVFYAGFAAVIVGYYLVMNEIQPQLPWAQRTWT
jgi:hypothetical protein